MPEVPVNELQSVAEDVKNALNELPKTPFWDAMKICQWEGFWFPPGLIKPAMTFRSTFQANDDDVLLASSMKTGTTWLKALCACIMKNDPCSNDGATKEDVLMKYTPQFLVPTIESIVYALEKPVDPYDMPSPRLFHTHLPYVVLPESVKSSGCKIVYLARNPKDTLISSWHFFNATIRPNQDPFPIDKAVEAFCNGTYKYGPYFDHVLQYWHESQKRPNKILFLKYEELKSDPEGQVMKLASFLGKTPFLNDEGIDRVLWMSSLERLKNLEVNKSGSYLYNVPNSLYFTQGVVGDWKNYLTPELEEKIEQKAREMLQGSGLTL